MNNNRRNEVRDYIYKQGDVKIEELLQKFSNVSSMTIRRDLAYWEKNKAIIRTRGGARVANFAFGLSEELYTNREITNIYSKEIIAKKAISLIEERRSLFLDSGTTIMALAKILEDQNLTIFTTGPNIGLEIIRHTVKPQITILGGTLNRSTLSTSGYNCINALAGVNIDIAFMSPSAFSMDAQFTVGNPFEQEIKSGVMKKARKCVMLMDASKVDKNMPYTFATMKEIDYIITDEKLPKEIEELAHANGVIIL